jgi:hypothetical protein
MFSWIGGSFKKEVVKAEDAIGLEDVQSVVKEIAMAKKLSETCHSYLITTISSEFVPSYAVLGWKEGDTLPLIRGTLDPEEEETAINDLLSGADMDKETWEDIVIVVYGRNALDESVMKKVKELRSFGFENVYGYVGGMFEWCLLSDIYGDKEFPMMGGGKKVDPLFYKGERRL